MVWRLVSVSPMKKTVRYISMVCLMAFLAKKVRTNRFRLRMKEANGGMNPWRKWPTRMLETSEMLVPKRGYECSEK